MKPTASDLKRAKLHTLRPTKGCSAAWLLRLMNNPAGVLGDIAQGLLRLKFRQPANEQEKHLIILAVAKGTGDVKVDSTGCNMEFRGAQFTRIGALREATATVLKSRFSEMELALLSL